ncbi:MAG: YhjD/YihY/BrkB family envelope integrity protein [Acidimicrobiia bacterium]
MADEPSRTSHGVAGVRSVVTGARARAERTLVWQVWERMLEIEFVDRSVALAGKAFVSFFPLVIVVASFMSASIRHSIYTTLTHRLGIEGDALASAKQAFKSSDDVRRATGFLGLLLTIFFASSFTTALQRVYLRAWRRPPGRKAGQYLRGPAWFLVILADMALLGALRGVLDTGALVAVFAVVSLLAVAGLWWFTAWFMLMGQVRWRALVPTGLVTAVAMLGYAVSASIWMPEVITRNQNQFGFFGVALALVTWFSGAAICILVGACAGAVLAADDGWIGRLTRGRAESVLVDGAEGSLSAPALVPRLRDAFRPTEDEVSST